MKPKEQWITEYEAQRHLPRNQRTLIHSNGSYIEAVQLPELIAAAQAAAKSQITAAIFNDEDLELCDALQALRATGKVEL